MDIGLLRPAILPKAILEFMKVMGIGLKRPANITQVTVEFMYVGQVLPSNLPLVITEDTLKDGGSSSQESSQYSTRNWGTKADVEGRGLYRSQTSQYSSHKQGERGTLLSFLRRYCLWQWENETSIISYYNGLITEFYTPIKMSNYKLFIFVMLVDGQVSTNPNKRQSESS